MWGFGPEPTRLKGFGSDTGKRDPHFRRRIGHCPGIVAPVWFPFCTGKALQLVQFGKVNETRWILCHHASAPMKEHKSGPVCSHC